MQTFTANTAFAPLNGANNLYPELGVDFLIAAEGSDGEADFQQWVPFEGADADFTTLEADDILRGAGYRPTTDWEPLTGEYWGCDIEPLTPLGTTIRSPKLVANGAGEWTGTLREAIRIDGDRLEERAVANGLPSTVDEWGDRVPNWEAFTLADWRTVFDDPNAEFVVIHLGHVLPLDPGHFRALREAAGLSQQDVAQWAGVTDRSARRWDVTHPAPDEVARFVIDQWEAVRGAAMEVAEQRPDLIPAGTTAQERAIARAAMLLLEVKESTARLVGP